MEVHLFASTYSEVHIRMLWFRLLAKAQEDIIKSSEVQQPIILQTTNVSA